MEAAFSKFELEDFAKVASQAFLDSGVDLNNTITKLARENEFTPHHIERVVQNTNILVNGALVKKARDERQDPRIRFDLASGEKVASLLRGNIYKTADLHRLEEVADLYTMPSPGFDKEATLNGVFGAKVASPYADCARDVNHEQLSASYLQEPERVVKIASRLTSSSIGSAIQILETLESQASQQHSLDKQAMDEAESGIRSQIHDAILVGDTPATIRSVVKAAAIDDSVKKVMDKIVTKVASHIEAREGVSIFEGDAIINSNHPLLCGARDVSGLVKKAKASAGGLKRITEARKMASRDMAAAVRSGR